MTVNTAPATSLAIYANYCEVGHNAFEFLLDFGQFRADDGAVQVHSRIVAGPVQTKLFARLMAEAIRQFEESHGEIPEIEDSDVASLFPPGPDFEARARALRAAGTQPSPRNPMVR